MAFPVPNHLPKRAIPVDVSSKILYKVDAATKDTLNASLASTWVQELDESILATRQRIHDRIQSDLPAFEHQLGTSKSIKERYNSLETRVNHLDDVVSNSNSGLIQSLAKMLQAHSSLAQETSNRTATCQGLLFLLQYGKAYKTVLSFVESGDLPKAVVSSREVDGLYGTMPSFLGQTRVVLDLKTKFNTTKTWIQDQLSDALSRSIIVSPTEIIIYPSIKVRQSETILQLYSILHSLSSTSLSVHLATVRRDLITYFVEHVLRQPYTVSVDTSLDNTARLSLIPSPPNNEDLSNRLINISTILAFLSKNLFPLLPVQEERQFKRSLSKPVTTSVLNNLVMPALPSSFGLLPSYLKLLRHAVSFEEKDIRELLDSDMIDGSIKAWSDGVSGHYERRRRIEILEQAREEVLHSQDINDTFDAFTEGGPETSLPSVVPVQMQEEDIEGDAWGLEEPATANATDETADDWSLDDDTASTSDNAPKGDCGPEAYESLDADNPADSWGFDDEPEIQPEADELESNFKGATKDTEPDPADAWGWKEDEGLSLENLPDNVSWDDDPWADPPHDEVLLESSIKPSAAASVVSPKAATRLEKLASKNRKHVNGNHSTSKTPPSLPLEPQVLVSPASPIKSEHNPPPKSSRLNPGKRPPAVTISQNIQEVYKVPKQTKRILKMVETVIDEGKLFFASNLFDSRAENSNSPPGSVLLQTASSILDLYQALYPVKFAKDLEQPDRAVLYSNSCIYMTSAVQRLEDTIYGQPSLKAKLTECRRHLQVLGDSWFEDVVEKQCTEIDRMIVEGAQGFTYTGDQDRYDECETAVNDALKAIKRAAHRLKGNMTKSKYYSVIGSLTETALSRILRDILALPDIPEVESHRLSELCRIINAVEGLFTENSTQHSLVLAYVPSWLKFSYLSELLEASLADITYLFEQGALVDFQVDELVALVRALFADTSLRANTINKIQSS